MLKDVKHLDLACVITEQNTCHPEPRRRMQYHLLSFYSILRQAQDGTYNYLNNAWIIVEGLL